MSNAKLPQNNPYEQLSETQPLTVTVAGVTTSNAGYSGDVAVSELPLAHVGKSHGGEELSPAISWEPVAGAASYVVTCYDPDAPTLSGFWHWVVYNIPADVTELPEGAGSAGSEGLPASAVSGYNEALGREFIGAAPPAGHGPHRYFFTVQALDTVLDLPADLTAARVHFMLREHVIARGSVVFSFEQPAN